MNRSLLRRLVYVAGAAACGGTLAAQAPTASPHGDLRLPCATCHTSAGWSPARVSAKFRHADYGPPLVGAHADASCMSCHRSLAFGGAATAWFDPISKVHVFTPRVAAALREDLARVLSAPDGADVRGAILDENPADIRVESLAPYPETAPLARVPATILTALPPVPDDVEYRFVGRRLVLRDARANLVVDVLPDAFR